MPPNRFRSEPIASGVSRSRRWPWRRCAPFPALAADRPATPEGAEALKALIAKYLPAAQAGALAARDGHARRAPTISSRPT